MYVKKILTYKSGNFAFSRKFSLRELQPLRTESRVLYETVKDLPILPELATGLEQELIRRSIFGTAAIEGNPLNEENVAEIISEQTSSKFPQRAEQEIKNLKDAYDFIKQSKVTNPQDFRPAINEGLIKKAHAVITDNIEYDINLPGKYRNQIVKVGDPEHGGIYTPPKCLEDINNLMEEFVSWINSEDVIKLDPPTRAALSHYYLGLIHPFGDGNGRTARLIEAIVLKNSGIKFVPVMLSNFYYKNIDEYFQAFSITRQNKQHDVTHFVKFVLRGFIDSLNEIKNRIIFYIRKFSLRDYYAWSRQEKYLTQRQHDLLLMLLEHDHSITMHDLFTRSPYNILYREVSERTAARDLNKLKNEFLKVTERGKYRLNWKAME